MVASGLPKLDFGAARRNAPGESTPASFTLVLITMVLAAGCSSQSPNSGQVSEVEQNSESRTQTQWHLDRAVAWYGKGEYEKAIASYSKLIRLDAANPLAYNNRGLAWAMKGEHDKAIADYNEAIRLNPNEAIANDCLAWLLATCPSAELLDGTRAVALATAACELTGWADDLPIQTLAAAYAESGNFKEAVERQQQAIDLLDGDADNTAYVKRLELYKHRKPYRHAPKSRSPKERYPGDV